MKLPKSSRILKYLNVAKAISLCSKDKLTKVGALLVDPDDYAILALGYNGPIRNASDNLIPQTRPEKYDYFIHAEANLIITCARHGISTKNKYLFITHSPCANCVRMLIQAGINIIFFKQKYRDYNSLFNLIDVAVQVIFESENYNIIRIKSKT